MKLLLPLLISHSLLGFSSFTSQAAELTPSFTIPLVMPLTIEEQRIGEAQQAMPHLRNFSWQALKTDWLNVTHYQQAKVMLTSVGERLWQFNKAQVQSGKRVDDRPLYWSRLEIKAFVKSSPSSFSITELNALLEIFENSSRGRSDLAYSKSTDKRILLTGFDPFFLDRDITQSNPSGLAILMLDGMVIELIDEKGETISAEINTAMVPVRYEDFDQGEIESLLAPYYALNSVDMIVTISMGRSDFDLEHFPGLRRSAAAPDNLNVYTGANQSKPIVPKLLNKALAGKKDEFVLFSLPYQAMMQAKGPYKINDNRNVTILELGKPKDIQANSIEALNGKVSVQGSGGGYLSNEISYRSILLRNKLGSSIATGHIHTPRISRFDEKTNQAIIEQIKGMLEKSLSDI